MNLNDPDFQKQINRWSPTSSRWLDPDMDPMDAVRYTLGIGPGDWTPVIAKAQALGLPYAVLIAQRMKEMQYDAAFLKQLGIAPLGVE